MPVRLRDPQRDVDDEIRQYRPIDHRDVLVAKLLACARSDRGRAELARRTGDLFGQLLHVARAEVRDQAANVLRTEPDLATAAAAMMDRARRLAVRELPIGLPIVDFDRAAIAYTKARTWQACAWLIDPEMPQVQPMDCDL